MLPSWPSIWPGEKRESLERLQREAGDLIDQHWPHIEAVANALIAERTLDGKGLREVIEIS